MRPRWLSTRRAMRPGVFLRRVAESVSQPLRVTEQLIQLLMSTSSTPKPPASADESFYTSWGLLAGAALGLIPGLLTGRWLSWPCALGTLGFFIGAWLDHRRQR